jgi:hypothetical protein
MTTFDEWMTEWRAKIAEAKERAEEQERCIICGATLKPDGTCCELMRFYLTEDK